MALIFKKLWLQLMKRVIAGFGSMKILLLIKLLKKRISKSKWFIKFFILSSLTLQNQKLQRDCSILSLNARIFFKAWKWLILLSWHKKYLCPTVFLYLHIQAKSKRKITPTIFRTILIHLNQENHLIKSKGVIVHLDFLRTKETLA